MTSEEREDLRALTVLVNEGFRELRELVESRRKEDHAAHVAIYERIEENRADVGEKVEAVQREQVSASSLRRAGLVLAGLVATWTGLLIAAATLYVTAAP